jgi:hypothetical protein
VWEYTLYKFKNVHVDADGDGKCGAGDRLFSDASAVLVDNTLWVPSEFTGASDCVVFDRPWPTE